MRIGTVLALLVLALTVAAVAWGPHLLVRLDDWGAPVVRETFADDGWNSRWVVAKGRLDRREGRLVSSGTLESALMLRQQLPGAVAIEFIGEVLPGARACDLSVCWYEQPVFAADGSVERLGAEHRLQLGAYDNSYSCIISGGQLVSYSDFILQVGRPYRIRAEIGASSLRLLVDGREILRHVPEYPLAEGHVGLFGYYPGKAFSQVTVWQRGDAGDGQAAVASRLARQGRHADAARAYQSAVDAVSPALRGAMQVAAARSWERAGDPEAATAAWQVVASGDHAALATLARLQREFSANALAGLPDRFVAAYRACPLRFRSAYHLAWARWVADIRARWLPLTVYRSFLDAYLACLTESDLVDREAAELFLLLKLDEEVLRRFPHQAGACAKALIAMGRPREALERYGQVTYAKLGILHALGLYDQAMVEGPPWSVAITLREAGRFQEVVDHYGDDRVSVAIALQKLGRFQEVLERFPELTAICQDCLIALGRGDEALASATHEDERMNVLLRLGRPREALALCERDFERQQTARDYLGLEAWIAGQAAEARHWFAPNTPFVHGWQSSFGVRRYLMQAFLMGLAGDATGRQARLSEALNLVEPWQGQVSRWAGILTGARPWQGETMTSVSAETLLVIAMAQEDQQALAEARSSYARFLADMPLADPVLRRFAVWRADLLASQQ